MPVPVGARIARSARTVHMSMHARACAHASADIPGLKARFACDSLVHACARARTHAGVRPTIEPCIGTHVSTHVCTHVYTGDRALRDPTKGPCRRRAARHASWYLFVRKRLQACRRSGILVVLYQLWHIIGIFSCTEIFADVCVGVRAY